MKYDQAKMPARSAQAKDKAIDGAGLPRAAVRAGRIRSGEIRDRYHDGLAPARNAELHAAGGERQLELLLTERPACKDVRRRGETQQPGSALEGIVP